MKLMLERMNMHSGVTLIQKVLAVGLLTTVLALLSSLSGIGTQSVYAEDSGCWDEDADVFICDGVSFDYAEGGTGGMRYGDRLNGTNSRGVEVNWSGAVIQGETIRYDGPTQNLRPERVVLGSCTPGTARVQISSDLNNWSTVGTISVSGTVPGWIEDNCNNDGDRYVEVLIRVVFDEPTEELTATGPITISLYDGDSNTGSPIDSESNITIDTGEGLATSEQTWRLGEGASIGEGEYTVCGEAGGSTVCETLAFGTDDVFLSSTVTIDGDTGIAGQITGEVIEGNPDGLDPDGIAEEECSGYSVLGWLLCPLTTGFLRFIENIFNGVILTHLVVDPLDDGAVEGTAERAVFDIWNSFRIIANVLFVIVFLVAIFGQGLAGFQFFSAYDFRKILPRLVIGIIGIQISWYIVGFMVDVFNIIGAGTRGLILAPVDGLQSLDFDFGAVADFVSVLLAGAAVWVASFTLSISGVLLLIPSLLLPIAIALIMALVVILFRKMLIFVLIVVSPIAFVLGILPNTQVFLKQWWEFFWKALFMYPIIIGFIAAGELTAKVLVAGNETSAVNQILGMIALFAPYFLITTTFRLAGAGLAAAAGGLQNMGGGFKERVLGDPRDKHSIRGRRRNEFQTKRRQSAADFVDRNKAGISSSYKNPVKMINAAADGGLRSAKKRRLPLAGTALGNKIGIPQGQGTVGGTIKKGLNKLPGTSFNPDKSVAGIAGAVGGLAAGIMVRTGLVSPEDQLSEANERSLKESVQMADYDASINMARIGMTHTPDGEAIGATQLAEGRRGAKDASKVTGDLIALMLWSRDAETHEQFRRTLEANPNFTDEQKDRIWGNATYYKDVKTLHPDLNNMDWRSGPDGYGQIKDGKVLDFMEKTTSRENINGMLQRGENTYRQMWSARMKITSPSTEGMSNNDRLAAAIGFNQIYDQLQDNAEQQMMYQNRAFIERTDPDDKSITEILADPTKRADALTRMYDNYRTSDPRLASATDREIMAEQMRKAYPETFGGLAGRKSFMAVENMRFSDAEIDQLRAIANDPDPKASVPAKWGAGPSSPPPR